MDSFSVEQGHGRDTSVIAGYAPAMFTFKGQLVTEDTVGDIDDIEGDSVASVMEQVNDIMPGATLYDEPDSIARWGEQAMAHWDNLGDNLLGVVGWEGRLVGHVYSPQLKRKA